MHPEANRFRVALATSSGRDISRIVEPDLVAADVLAATHSGSDQKLRYASVQVPSRTVIDRTRTDQLAVFYVIPRPIVTRNPGVYRENRKIERKFITVVIAVRAKEGDVYKPIIRWFRV